MGLKYRRKLICVVFSAALVGCGINDPSVIEETESNQNEASTSSAPGPAARAEAPSPATSSSLAPGSALARLATDLDRQATARSSAVQDIAAAEANLRARRFDRYPQIRPTASAPLAGSGQASIGVNIEQVLWDGGRISARLTDADLRIANATLEAWEDRNDTVYEGLEASVDIARFEARLEALAALRRELEAISVLLDTRREGGVADRGETLRMASALQEVDRRVVADTASLREVRTELVRLLPEATRAPSLSDLGAAAAQCRRVWPQSEAPADALARVRLARVEASEGETRAQRFPRLVLSGGRAYAPGSGWSEPTVGLTLDASDMLGLGRRGNLEAAAASTRAAEASYGLQREDTQAELSRLEADYEGLRADITALRGLLQQGDETIALYREQLDAGSIPLTEGIVLHREHTDTRVSLIDAQADILLNCLLSSRNRGLLAPFGALND